MVRTCVKCRVDLDGKTWFVLMAMQQAQAIQPHKRVVNPVLRIPIAPNGYFLVSVVNTMSLRISVSPQHQVLSLMVVSFGVLLSEEDSGICVIVPARSTNIPSRVVGRS